jgi:hypothetical protein
MEVCICFAMNKSWQNDTYTLYQCFSNFFSVG